MALGRSRFSADDASWRVAYAFLALVGVCVSAQLLYRFILGVYVYFLRPGKNLKRYGPWAVVTGATDGIGKAYTEVLARAGLNVVLISRTQQKLDEEASSISQKYNVETRTIAVDLSQPGDQKWGPVAAVLTKLDVGLLINNAGRSYDHAEYFDAVDAELISSLIEINIQAVNKLIQIVLPGMKKRKRSVIVNIGSAAATVLPSGPLYAAYAGTKAYVDMLSKSLDLEYAKSGIRVQNQAPMYVATKMAKIRKPRLDAPSPKQWAKSAARHIGFETTSCPYWVHGIMWAAANRLPTWVLDRYTLNLHKSLYVRYKKKMEKAK